MRSSKMTITSAHTVLTTPSFTIEQRELQIPAVGSVTRHVVLHNGAVVILAINELQEVVLVRQYRHAIDQWLLELPAGTLEYGESPRACAERELSEEAGFGASQWSELGIIYPAPGFCSEKQYLFVARGLFPRKLEADQDEMIEVVTMPLMQVCQSISNGEICDAKSIALLARAGLLTPLQTSSVVGSA